MQTDHTAHNGSILVLDSDANLRWFMARIFKPKGYEILEAHDSQQALRFIQNRSGKMDLVICDPALPSVGGVEFIKSLHRNYPSLPVIVLTADSEQKKFCQPLGLEAVMDKPYSLEELDHRVDSVMERQLLDKAVVRLDPNVVASARILIVDDEQQVCELLSEALFEDSHGADFKVQWVTSGEEALRVSKEFQPDLAIIDIRMPKMWGDELIMRFKSGEGHCPRDFVIYTSVTESREIERAKQLGHKFIAKPTDLDILLEVLIKLCIKHHLLKKVTA